MKQSIALFATLACAQATKQVVSFVADDDGSLVVDDSGKGSRDAQDWDSKDGNWEVFGEAMLAGGKLFLERLDGAGDVLGNEDLYKENFWNDLEEHKWEYERIEEAE